MTDSEHDLAWKLVAAKLARVSTLARQTAETEKGRGTGIDFSPLLDRCEELDLFLNSGCLDFGLEIMGNTLYLLLKDFMAVAGRFTGDSVGSHHLDAKSDLGQALLLCEEIIATERPKLH